MTLRADPVERLEKAVRLARTGSSLTATIDTTDAFALLDRLEKAETDIARRPRDMQSRLDRQAKTIEGLRDALTDLLGDCGEECNSWCSLAQRAKHKTARCVLAAFGDKT